MPAKAEVEARQVPGQGSLPAGLRDKLSHPAEQERKKPEGQIFGNVI